MMSKLLITSLLILNADIIRGQCHFGCVDRDCKMNGDCKNYCKNGYYGYKCDKCGYCTQTECDLDGYCTNGCVSSFYYGSRCNEPCPKNCKELQGQRKCHIDTGVCINECIAGWTGATCNACAIGYFYYQWYCAQCQPNCQSCTAWNQCNACVENSYYGTECNISCSPGCASGQCLQSDGFCYGNCVTGYKGNNCNQCSDKYHMSSSQCIPCPTHCNTCISTAYCGECASGYFGQTCQNSCSPGCNGHECNKDTGSCDCKLGFKNYNCNQCVDEKYGNNCDMDCPTNCTKCDSGISCESCRIGLYGTLCELSCPAGCRGGCNKSLGTCMDCKDGYSGNLCCAESNNCQLCSSESQCSNCTSGFYDALCLTACPKNCDGECEIESGDCISCKTGYYGRKCESRCSKKCISCGESGLCDSCIDGFYGSYCNRACPINCISCNNETLCDSCREGFYGTTCISPCLDNCASCITSTMCAQCKTGYFGVLCSGLCPVNCVSCSSTTSCNLCKEGFSGATCNVNCSTKCKSCLIEHSFLCTSCARGTYSSNINIYNGKQCLYCDKKCSENCLNGFCDDRTAVCTDGCLNGFNGDRCYCPDNCKADFCYDRSVCHEYYCKTGFSGHNCACSTDLCTDSTCTSCINNSSYVSDRVCCKCPSTCKDSVCLGANGCLNGCIDGFYGDGCQHRCLDRDIQCLTCTTTSCNQCLPGYFPSTNKFLCTMCSVNCVNGICSTLNGTCLNGCSKGFWGANCENRCEQYCNECDRNDGACSVCINDRYERDCSKTCSNKCMISGNLNICDIDDGSCKLGCSNNNTYGAMCHLACSTTCAGQTCEWITGKCIMGCEIGYHGEWCENQCSDNCMDNPGTSSCDSTNGTCHVGCKDGYYRHDCQTECGTNCINKTCDEATGMCIHGCSDGFEGSNCAMALPQSGGDKTGVVAGAAAGGLVFLLLIAAVVVVVLFRKRMNINSEPSNFSNATYQNHAPHLSLTNSLNLESDPDNMDTEDARRLCDIGATTSQPVRDANELALPNIAPGGESSDGEEYLDEPIRGEDEGDTYYNTGAIRRMAVDSLANYVANKSDEDFKLEFGSFPKDLVKPYAVSQLPGNVNRNRYNKVYPYDENRVKLQHSSSDYINASYIDGFERKNEYIAALGPTRDTTDNFATVWSMIWQQKVEKLVMLTNLQEGPKMKCHQYWPNPGNGETYGDVKVTCLAEDTYAEYTVRSLSAIKDREKRVIYHLHYTGHPDRSVPDDVTGMIEFRNKVLRVKATLDGPVLVHCSAGVGRTGTYIALDYLTNEGEETESVDVFECVSSLRQQRIWMVQAEEQYVYLHDAVVHTLTFDSHPIQSDKFLEYVKSLTPANLDRMYSHLKSGHRHKDEKEVKAVAKNQTYKNKNNPAADIPGDRYRPRIHLSRTQGECDYINAVYLNSFWFRNHYIAAQTPLTSTVDDFLTLLFQEHIPCIVDMQPNHSKQKNIGEYLPADNQKITPHRDFAIRIIKVKSNTQFTLRRLIITRNSMQGPEERTFHHYQFVAWQDNEPTPPSPEDFINFVREVEAKSKEDFDDAKILVHCLTGAGRSCLFPAVSVMLQKMESEQEVSVVNTVRQIQSRRPSAIPDKEQYLFCHECIRVFLDSFDTYSNFAMR